jgi:hypothetical protein
MYGYDLDHNGMIDRNELGSDGLAAAFNSANDTGRGIAPFITVWGIEPNTNANGKPRVNIGVLAGNSAALRQALSPLPQARINQIVTRAQTPGVRITSVIDFALRAGMTPTELAQVEDHLTASPLTLLPGLINVNTASQQVLMCLPELTQDDVSKIIAHRSTTNGAGNNGLGGLGGALGIGGGLGGSGAASPTNVGWIMDPAILARAKAVAIGPYITGRSYFYSADIVAVAGDGRAFRRVRIVVDARNSPPSIVFRKDLTHLGWPLSPDILAALKTHQQLPAVSGMGTGGANGLSVLSH